MIRNTFVTQFVMKFCHAVVTNVHIHATSRIGTMSMITSVHNLVDAHVLKVILVDESVMKFALRVNGQIRRKQC